MAQPAEAHEEPTQVFGGDSDSLIADRHEGDVVFRRERHDDVAAPRRILDGIVDQVVDDNLQSHQVAKHPELAAHGIIEVKPVLGARGHPGHQHRPPNDLAEIDPFALELRPLILEPRRLHHLVRQQTDLLGLGLQDRYHRTHPLRNRT